MSLPDSSQKAIVGVLAKVLVCCIGGLFLSAVLPLEWWRISWGIYGVACAARAILPGRFFAEEAP